MTAAPEEHPGLQDLAATALLDALADADHRARAAEREKLELTYLWALAHPATSESGTSTWGGDSFLLADESLGGEGTPAVAAYAAEPLAVTLGISPATAQQLIADVLDLRYRLPRCWALVQSLKVPAWRARRVATATHALSAEAAEEVDKRVGPKLKHAGPRAIDHAIAMAIAKHQPEDQSEAEDTATAGWDVTLFTPDPLLFAGTSELHVVGDTVGLTRLYQQICTDAAAAGKNGDDRPLGVRKAEALVSLVEEEPLGDVSKPPHPTGAMTLFVHCDLTDLDDDIVAVGEVEKLGPATTTKIRDWLSRGKVRIQPVIWMDTAAHHPAEPTVDRHDPPERMREQVILRDKTCVFPGCQVGARSCDLDHIDPYDPTGPPGQTAPSKLAPLCRRHHRAKTAGLWRYLRLPEGGYQWSGPAGLLAVS
jgi:hypothetical protein